MIACAFDPPCARPVIDVMVFLNPSMPSAPVCAQHALTFVMGGGL